MINPKDIKPCQCGGKAILWHGYIGCTACGLHQPNTLNILTDEDRIEKWNTRVKIEACQSIIKDADRSYPCIDCGKLRTKDEGGTTFTVCDECWDKKYKRKKPKEDINPPTYDRITNWIDKNEK